MNIEQARFNMIEQQIRPWNVLDDHILALLNTVKREDFVAPAHKSLAFADLELPLPAGQCMLPPRVEARLLQDLKVKKTDRVLEIGAGSGYMATLLAHEAAQVVTIDNQPLLVELARTNLAQAGVRNVEVQFADGSKNASNLGEFDVILLSGSVASVPQALLSMLKPGGRLAAIVGDEPVMQAHFVTRTGERQFETRTPWDIVAPRLSGFAETPVFHF